MKHVAPLIVAAFALSGCGSVTTSLPPRSMAAKQLADATFIIHWVAPHPLTHARRRPQFISPSAQSLVVGIDNDPTLKTIVPRSGASTSMVAFKAPPGNDTITFTVWDGINGDGNELGQATIAATITAGTANTVSATLDGIVASVKVAPLPSQPLVTSTTSPGGTTTFAILGDAPQTFAITTFDPDGNAIVPDGNPITYTLNQTSGFFTTSSVSANGQFTVQVQQVDANALPAAFTVDAQDGQGDLAQNNYSIQTNEVMLVGYANGGSGSIVAMLPSGTPVQLPGTFPGLTSPLGMVYASDLHRLFVLDASGSVLAYGSDGTAPTGFASPKISGATGITYDVNNHLLYVVSATSVSAFKGNDGTAAMLAGTFPGLAGAVGIAVDPNRSTPSIEIADAGTSQIDHFDELGNPQQQSIANLMGSSFFSTAPIVPSAISGDDAGDAVIVGNNGTSDQLEVTFANMVFSSPTSQNLSGPDGIAFDPVSRFFVVANATSGTLTSYNAFGKNGVFSPTISFGASIAPPNGLSHPTSLTFVP